MRRPMFTHMWQKQWEVLFCFCPVRAIWNEFDISHCMRGNLVSHLHQPLEQWPHLNMTISMPSVSCHACLSALVFFCKMFLTFCLSFFKHDGKIMSKNERRKSSILHLSNLLQGKKNSAPFSKHQEHFKTPRNLQQWLGTVRDRVQKGQNEFSYFMLLRWTQTFNW